MVLTKFNLFIFSFILLVSCSGNQKDKPIQEVSSAALKVDLRKANTAKGGELYKTHCIACHGTDGKMGIGGSADLTKSVIDTVQIVEILNNGRNGMPAFKDILSNEKNILSVTAFVLKLRK